MAETSKVDKDDNLEDSLSSEEWTIIYKKESEVNCISKEEIENNVSNNSKEIVDAENICHVRKDVYIKYY
jgi:hypothetical protein